MSFFSREKRKNDAPRGLPWWALVAGFIVGVILTLSLSLFFSRQQSDPIFETPDRHAIIDYLDITATHLIQEATTVAATATAQAGS